MTKRDRPFWEVKTLEALTPEEWDQLCDGCGRCCLHKLVDEDRGKYFFTRVACQFLDLQTARCRVYEHRKEQMPSCVQLTPADAARWSWLPPDCAYRLRAEGKRLPGWHPLISDNQESVRLSGHGLPSDVVPEEVVDISDLENYINGSRHIQDPR